MLPRWLGKSQNTLLNYILQNYYRMSNQIQKLIKHSSDPDLMGQVIEFARQHYRDQRRTTGQTYIDHALDVALILQNLGTDQTTIAAGVLHDTANAHVARNPKDVLIEIKNSFGQDIATLIENSSNIGGIYHAFSASRTEEILQNEKKAESLRKMFFAIAKDARVALIELAARIDGLNRISEMPEPLRKLYALETLHIFVPIANRLGLGEIKRTLEDTAFEHLYPKDFAWLQEQLQERYQHRQQYLRRFIPKIKKILRHERIAVHHIDSRAKSYWSTWQKLKRRDMDIEKVYDLVALRIIVPTVADCYKTLGIIHKHYKPFSGQIQDYIAKPKENGYQSIHTTVFLEEDQFSEIQIRTQAMHQEAQFGICAHWAYKEKLNPVGAQTLAWSKEIPEFLKTFNINFFQDRIFTFTPKGDIIELPKGSTPVDFAYAVHSDIGNHCESAKISGKIIPLSQPLKNGDIVEIITNKKRKPSQDWLRFVKTGFAKSHIKKLFIDLPVSLFSVPSLVKKKIVEFSKKRDVLTPAPAATIAKPGVLRVYLAGQKGMMVTIAKCCDPKPGDPSRAYLSKYRAAVLHKTSCKFLQEISQKFPQRVIDASWR